MMVKADTPEDLEWEEFKVHIALWARMQITNEKFADYLRTTQWRDAMNKRLADIFLAQEKNGEWESLQS